MKPILTIPLAAAMLLTGCTSLVSLNPFFTDEEAVADPALTGVWTHDDTTFLIRQEDKTYSITYIEKSNAMKFEARMIHVGGAKLLDLVPVNDDPFSIPVHSLVRVWTEGATLRWTFLESDWLKEQVGRRLSTQPASEKRTLITAAGPALRDTIVKFAADEKAYEKAEILSKVQ